MLIECPECGKEISNKAISCPYCGYQNSELNLNSHTIIEYNCPVCKNKEFIEKLDKGIIECSVCGYCHIVDEKKNKDYKSAYMQTNKQSLPKCPKCGSTNIQMLNRKFSLLTGFATNKVDRVCVNCKHKW